MAQENSVKNKNILCPLLPLLILAVLLTVSLFMVILHIYNNYHTVSAVQNEKKVSNFLITEVGKLKKKICDFR